MDVVVAEPCLLCQARWPLSLIILAHFSLCHMSVITDKYEIQRAQSALRGAIGFPMSHE